MFPSLLQTLAVALLPAFGAVRTVMFNVALLLAQGRFPVTVYVYAPPGWFAGLKLLPCGPFGPVHVPPAEGFPFRCAINGKTASSLQTVIEAFEPALAGATCETVTVAVAEGHGGWPRTV